MRRFCSQSFLRNIEKLNFLSLYSHNQFDHVLISLFSDPPGKPVLTVPTDIVENQTQTFICTSEGGYPSPNITWTLGSTVLPSNEFTTTISNDGNRVTSRLTRPLSNLDDGKLLLCEAENILRSDSTSETLNVKCE